MLTPQIFFSTKRILTALVTSALLCLSVLAGTATRADAANLVETYPQFDDRAVGMVISGNFGYVVLENGTLNRIDLTGPVDATSVTQNWAAIELDDPQNDLIETTGIQLIGSNIYVASTITIDNYGSGHRQAWISQISLTGTVVKKWATLTDLGEDFLSADALTSSATEIYLAFSVWETSQSASPNLVGVRKISSANPASTTDWTNTTTPDLSNASQVVVANGWVYVLFPGFTNTAPQLVLCANLTGNTFGTCLDLDTWANNGLSPVALSIVDGIAYMTQENWDDEILIAYTLSGSSFTETLTYPLQAKGFSIMVVGTTIYIGSYQKLSTLTVGTTDSLDPEWALMPQGAELVQLLSNGIYFYSVNYENQSISRVLAPSQGGGGSSGTLPDTGTSEGILVGLVCAVTLALVGSGLVLGRRLRR